MKLLLGMLLGLGTLFAPLWPGRTLTLKVRFAHYACEPCRSAYAYRVIQVYDPADKYLLEKDVVLYYEDKYFVEHPSHTVADIDRDTRILARLRWRSLFGLVEDMYEADVYKWSYR